MRGRFSLRYKWQFQEIVERWECVSEKSAENDVQVLTQGTGWMMVLLAEKGIWENESLGMGMVEIIYSIWTGRMKGISETLMEMTRGWVSGSSGTLNHWTWRVLRSVVKTRVAF